MKWRVGVPVRMRGQYGLIPPRVMSVLAQLDYAVVPILPGQHPRTAVFDSLLLTGGTDPNPLLFSAQGDPKENYDDERDERELSAIDFAIQRGLPMLGVCRGAELLSIYFGGTLSQLEDAQLAIHQGPADIAGRRPQLHDVDFAEDSRLSQVLDCPVLARCSSNHKTGVVVHDTARLVAAGWAPDGVVETIVGVDSLAVGIMWHPEDTYITDGNQLRLVEATLSGVNLRP